MHKGRFLYNRVVRIKVIPSATSKDENAVKVRLTATDGNFSPRSKSLQNIRREVELWAKVQEMDQGQIFYRFMVFICRTAFACECY